MSKRMFLWTGGALVGMIFAQAGTMAATTPPPAAGAAQQCASDLDALRQQMAKEGHMVGEWAMGFGAPPVAPAAPGPAVAPSTPPAAPAWGYYGIGSPRYQVEVLYSAANILASKGDQQGCESVVAALRSTDQQFGPQLNDTGNWASSRKQEIAAAKPVDQLGSTVLTSRDLIGSGVRNDQDQSLGSISDVIFDPGTSKIAYLVVARGGFLGIGKTHVPVPFSKFKVTPSLNLLVLNTSNDVIAKAPEVDPSRFAVRTTFGDQKQKIDQYWDNQKS